jgi:hypothetical protein
MKQHVAGGHGKHKSASNNSSFAESTAAVTGKDGRSIQRAVAHSEALGDDLKAIAGTS